MVGHRDRVHDPRVTHSAFTYFIIVLHDATHVALSHSAYFAVWAIATDVAMVFMELFPRLLTLFRTQVLLGPTYLTIIWVMCPYGREVVVALRSIGSLKFIPLGMNHLTHHRTPIAALSYVGCHRPGVRVVPQEGDISLAMVVHATRECMPK